MQHHQNNALFTIKAIADAWPFDINTIQLQKTSANKNDFAKSYNHFQIIWITKGNGSIWIDLEKCKFQDNYLFFVQPGQMYTFESAEDPDGYIISFTDAFLGLEQQQFESTYHNGLFYILSKSSGITISDEAGAEMKDLAEKMIKEYINLHLFRDEMLQRYLKILFIYLSRQVDGSLQTTRLTRNVELVQKFISLLDRHFKTEKMVSGYADMLLVTPNYLNEIIKKTTGYPAGHHIRQRIVLEAKRQATYSGTCMKQIGYYLGFNDMAHFSKFFKSATGMNFTDFKKEKMVISMAS